MTTLYKLTDQNSQTRGDCQWGENVSSPNGILSGEGELCGPGWYHAYTDPLLAAFLNPIHANFPDPVLWECEGDVGATDNGLKVGCRSLTTVRRLPMPVITTEQRVKFAILCAREVYEGATWKKWADGWLCNIDRSPAAAREAARTAAREAAEAARTAAWAAAEAAEAAEAAREAAEAARAAAEAYKPIDLIAIARKAML